MAQMTTQQTCPNIDDRGPAVRQKSGKKKKNKKRSTLAVVRFQPCLLNMNNKQCSAVTLLNGVKIFS